MRRLFVIGLLSLALPASAATFTVTNTAPSDSGSLRQAILGANANPGPTASFSRFRLPACRRSSSRRPFRRSQSPSSSTDSLSRDRPRTRSRRARVSTPFCRSRSTARAAAAEPCFTISAGNDDLLVMAIQGLVINRCPVGAIDVVAGGSGAVIAGNYIGPDPTGTSLPGPQGFGVRVVNALHVAIGGTFAFERNLISGNTDGVVTDTAAFLAVRGNLIGTNAAGTAALVEDFVGTGLRLDIAAFAVVGGDEAGARNVISGVGNRALIVSSADTLGRHRQLHRHGRHRHADHRRRGRHRGRRGVAAHPRQRRRRTGKRRHPARELELHDPRQLHRHGSLRHAGARQPRRRHLRPGGERRRHDRRHRAGEGNVIAHNGRRLISFIGGVHVRNRRTKIRGNRIFDNRYLGIDLLGGRAGGSVTPNDPGDLDGGPNANQNFPIITDVGVTGAGTDVFGYLDSTPSTTFDIDFFAGPRAASSRRTSVQGERYIGSLTLATDASGRVDFLTTVPYQLAAGRVDDRDGDGPAGRTSEFSQRLILSIEPALGSGRGRHARLHRRDGVQRRHTDRRSKVSR